MSPVITQPTANAARPWSLAIDPVDTGADAYQHLFARYRLANVRVRFVGSLPDNAVGNFALGVTEHHRVLPNTRQAMVALSRSAVGRSNTTSPWLILPGPHRSEPYELRQNADLHNQANTAGFIHLFLDGGTAETDNRFGTAHGYVEVSYDLYLSVPISL